MGFIIRRLTFNSQSPTYGALFNDVTPICLTFELPYKDNEHDISCVLQGTYPIIPNTSDKPWRLCNVPNRTAIDMHAGNTIADSLGCILLGFQFSPNCILHSVDAVNYCKKILPEKFDLTIVNPIG